MTLRPGGEHQRDRGFARGGLDHDRFVFARPVRQVASIYVAAVALACVAVAPSSMSDRAYVEAMVLVSALCWGPGTVIALYAARSAPRRDRWVWRLWLGGFAFGWLTMVRVLRIDDVVWEAIQRRAIGAGIISVAILVLANTLILRARSGQRAVLIDVADIVMASAAIIAPLVLLVGEPILEAEARWFTVGSAIWFLAALYSTAVAVVLYLRVRPQDRAVARYGIAFGLLALASTSAQAYMGVHDFGLRPGPFLAAHALCAGFTVIFLVHSTRRASTGLERFSARAQVRRRPVITLLVLVSIPVTGALVWVRRDDDWAVLVALVAAGVLVSLFCVRGLLAARETRLLYREVERSADDRADLLTDVLAHAEADRHRVATHLHRQSVQLYTALATVTAPVGSDGAASGPSARVAERLRIDLGRQSDELRRFAQAVRPAVGDAARSATAPTSSVFTTLLRVELDGLYGEGRTPSLVSEVDPDLVLDWTDEAVLVRIAEVALRALSARAPNATFARVGLAPDAAGAVVLDLLLEGRADTDAGAGEREPLGPLDPDGPELAPVRAGAELLAGTVEVTGCPATVGLRIRFPIGGQAAPSSPPVDRPPALRLVD